MENPLTEKLFQEIVEEYKKSIVIPDEKPKHQFFLCTVGLVGAGKTTVIKPLASRLSLIRISGDEIRKILKSKGLGYDKVWNIGDTIGIEFARQGYSLANDTDGATPKTREALEKLANELGTKVFYIHINPPEEFILNKLRNFKHTWLFKDGDQAIENYYQRKHLHENLNLPYLFTFDTSANDLEEQINKAAVLIKSESGNN